MSWLNKLSSEDQQVVEQNIHLFKKQQLKSKKSTLQVERNSNDSDSESPQASLVSPKQPASKSGVLKYKLHGHEMIMRMV